MSFPVHCKLTHPEYGYDKDKERAAKLLEANGPDHVYTISQVMVNQSSTQLYFYGSDTHGLDMHPWNSVQFDACDPWGNLLVEPDDDPNA